MLSSTAMTSTLLVVPRKPGEMLYSFSFSLRINNADENELKIYGLG